MSRRNKHVGLTLGSHPQAHPPPQTQYTRRLSGIQTENAKSRYRKVPHGAITAYPNPDTHRLSPRAWPRSDKRREPEVTCEASATADNALASFRDVGEGGSRIASTTSAAAGPRPILTIADAPARSASRGGFGIAAILLVSRCRLTLQVRGQLQWKVRATPLV